MEKVKENNSPFPDSGWKKDFIRYIYRPQAWLQTRHSKQVKITSKTPGHLHWKAFLRAVYDILQVIYITLLTLG